jgi:peptidoglycan/LPS O-acetylase OafA/YrhL
MQDSFLDRVFEWEANFQSWSTSWEILLMCLVPLILFMVTKVVSRFR